MIKLLLLLAFIVSVAMGAVGQTPAPAKPEAPVIPAEKLLQLRTLTYEQSKQIILIQQAKEQHKLIQEAIENWVRLQAAELKIDLETHYFDLDSLKFKKRPLVEKKNVEKNSTP
jgi:hypothetical protein